MDTSRLWSLIRFIITAIALLAVWLLFSGSLEPFSLIIGIVGALVIASLTYNEFIAQHDASLRSFLPRPFALAAFSFILVLYLYQSSWFMLLAVLSGRVNPRIVHFRTRLRSDLARMVLSNSITFTPGTITLDLNDDHLTVHWFFCTTSHARAAGDAVKGRMEKHLRKVWL
ncbi:MAG: Na+/H+ antiporter subunit E [Spirochaetes bacterium]|nr:Na+/H+ antiporter subunit E [Spirochaetota bacterium]MBU0954519.1 Na+/H+ antiporter subunit E [Spirochaetota bacterium]